MGIRFLTGLYEKASKSQPIQLERVAKFFTTFHPVLSCKSCTFYPSLSSAHEATSLLCLCSSLFKFFSCLSL